MNTLREASLDELHKLFSYMKCLLPESEGMYSSLDMHINYHLFDGFDTKFYVSKNKNQLQSFVVMYPYFEAKENQDSQVFNIFWDVTAEKDEDVMSCLRSLPNIDWNKKYLVRSSFSIMEKFRYISKYFSGENVQIDYKIVVDNFIYETATPDIQLPPGFRLGSLDPKHVRYVHSKVGNRLGESEAFVAAQFSRLPSSAVYKITDNVHDTQHPDEKHDDKSDLPNTGEKYVNKSDLPVAFSSLRHMGAIGRTFTLPEYRGLGMAKVVTQDLIKKLNNDNSMAWLSVEPFNHAATRTYEKLGFVKKSKTVFAAFEPFDR